MGPAGAAPQRPHSDVTPVIVRAAAVFGAIGTPEPTNPVAIYGYTEIALTVRWVLGNPLLTQLDVAFEELRPTATQWRPSYYERATVGGTPGEVDVGTYIAHDTGLAPGGVIDIERLYVFRTRGVGQIRAVLTPPAGAVAGGSVEALIARLRHY